MYIYITLFYSFYYKYAGRKTIASDLPLNYISLFKSYINAFVLDRPPKVNFIAIKFKDNITVKLFHTRMYFFSFRNLFSQRKKSANKALLLNSIVYRLQ